MKNLVFKYIVTINLLFIQTNFLYAQKLVRYTGKAQININQLKQWGNTDKTKQPISNEDNAENILAKINKELNDTELNKFLTGDWYDNKAVIFVHHPVDIEKLYQENKDSLAIIGAKVCRFISEKDTLSRYRFELKKRFNNNQGQLEAVPAPSTARIASIISTNESILSQLVDIENRVLKLSEGVAKLTARYKSYSPQILEQNKVEYLVLSKENGQWSNYLLEKRKIMIVFLGSFKNAYSGISLENNKTAFETSLSDLREVVTKLGVTPPLGAVGYDGGVPNCVTTEESKIDMTYFIIDESKIKFPSTISISDKDLKEDISIKIHEKAIAQFKVGISAANLEEKQFVVNDNQLTITPNPIKPEEYKGNFIALIDFYPWGRDVDRLDLITNKDKDTRWIADRLGFVFGAQISKDPLQALLGGLSYTTSKEASLNLGLGFYRTPKDVQNLPVGTNATLDYLRENADQTYEPKLFFGVSFAPSIISKSIVTKKE